jgi:hypothetical protein
MELPIPLVLKPLVGRLFAAAVIAVLSLCATASGALAETRAYAVSWFYWALVSAHDDCPGGINAPVDAQYREQIPADSPLRVNELLRYRGNMGEGKVNVYLHPTAVPDPHLHTAVGRMSYGFNLDGRDGPSDFIDAETSEAGIDNQMARVLGCITAMRGTLDKPPAYPSDQWNYARDSKPAWLVMVTAPGGFTADGEADIEIMRATRPVVRDSTGEPELDTAFEIDGDPRTYNRVHAHLTGGLLTTDMFDFDMVDDPTTVPESHIRATRIRLKIEPNRTLKGFLGGYESWAALYGALAVGGPLVETAYNYDIVGVYYALKQHADAYPDPNTGQNAAISVTYRLEAVPVLVANSPARTARLAALRQSYRP